MNLNINPLIAARRRRLDRHHRRGLRVLHLGRDRRHRFRAANWSATWYLLSAFAVISYTSNPIYVAFAALGSWVGAFASVTFMHRQESPRHDPP